jgi:hypothetical protein
VLAMDALINVAPMGLLSRMVFSVTKGLPRRGNSDSKHELAIRLLGLLTSILSLFSHSSQDGRYFGKHELLERLESRRGDIFKDDLFCYQSVDPKGQ